MAGTKRKRGGAQPPQPTVYRSARVQAFKDAFYSDTSDSDDENLRSRVTTLGKLRHKRGRRPKRPATRLPRVPGVSEDDLLFESSDESEEEVTTSKTICTELVVGPTGPQLKFGLMDLLENTAMSVSGLLEACGLMRRADGRSSSNVTKSNLFTDLPAEIRQRIYRELFVTKDRPIIFVDRKDFRRSAQFLRTCRDVHAEGSMVLYGENSFHFSRTYQNRGTYYEEAWTDVGFRDVRHFFTDIGRYNIAKLRYVSFVFNDSTVTLAPNNDLEERFFANDPILIHILTMLARYAKLNKLAVGFRGRRGINARDHHFLQALCSIRCQHAIEDQRHGNAIEPGVWNEIKQLCEVPANADSNINEELKKTTPAMYHERAQW